MPNRFFSYPFACCVGEAGSDPSCRLSEPVFSALPFIPLPFPEGFVKNRFAVAIVSCGIGVAVSSVGLGTPLLFIYFKLNLVESWKDAIRSDGIGGALYP